MILLLAGCSNSLEFADGVPVNVGPVHSALFVESRFSAPPDDGYGLVLLSSSEATCEQVFEADTFGMDWLGENPTFTGASGLLVELRWLGLGWEGDYPVGGRYSTDEGLREATLYAFEAGRLVVLNTDSGVVTLAEPDEDGAEGRVDTLQAQGRFRAENCGQNPEQGYYGE